VLSRKLQPLSNLNILDMTMGSKIFSKKYTSVRVITLTCLIAVSMYWFTGCSGKPPLMIIEESSQPVIWLANGSPVNFNDLYELGHELTKLNQEIQKDHSKSGFNSSLPIRFEGFLDTYNEGSYGILSQDQSGKCLSPEAEWLIYFPPETRAEINAILSDFESLDDESIKEKLRKLRVELRGMIEGKWLDVLRDEGRKPNWISASGKNNVVSELYAATGLELTIDNLDKAIFLQSGAYFNHERFPKIIKIFKKTVGSATSYSNEHIYCSTIQDLISSALFKPFLARGGEPVLAITYLVLEKIVKVTPEFSGRNLAGINLSAHGDYAALVNSPERREDAQKSTWLGVKYALRYLTFDKPRIGMRIITEQAANENDGTNCLKNSEEYVLYLYGSDRNSAIGEATIRLGNQ